MPFRDNDTTTSEGGAIPTVIARVDERPDVGDPMRIEELDALRRGKPAIGVSHVVAHDGVLPETLVDLVEASE